MMSVCVCLQWLIISLFHIGDAEQKENSGTEVGGEGRERENQACSNGPNK